MKKQILGLGLSLVLGLSLLPGGLTAAAEELPPAIEAEETQQVEVKTHLNKNTLTLTAEGSPYYLNENENLEITGKITVNGHVSLLLPKGAILTVAGGISGHENKDWNDESLTILEGSAGTLTGKPENGLQITDLSVNLNGGKLIGSSNAKTPGIEIGRNLDVDNGTVIGNCTGDGDGVHIDGTLKVRNAAQVSGESTGGNGVYSNGANLQKDFTGTIKGTGNSESGCGVNTGTEMSAMMSGTIIGTGAIGIEMNDFAATCGTLISEKDPIICGGTFVTMSGQSHVWVQGTVYNGRTGREMDMIGQSGFFTSHGRTLVGGDQNLSTIAGGADSYTVQPGEELDIAGTLTIDIPLTNKGMISLRKEGKVVLDGNGTLESSQGDLRKEMTETEHTLTFKVNKGNWSVGMNLSDGKPILANEFTVNPYQKGTIDEMGNFTPTDTGTGILPAYRIPTDVRPDAGMIGGSWNEKLPVDEPITESKTYTLTLTPTFATVDTAKKTVTMSEVLCTRGTVIAAAYQGGRQTGVAAGEAREGGTLTGFGSGDTVRLFLVDGNGSPICPMISAGLN